VFPVLSDYRNITEKYPVEFRITLSFLQITGKQIARNPGIGLSHEADPFP
jgi:hypothetical protein